MPGAEFNVTPMVHDRIRVLAAAGTSLNSIGKVLSREFFDGREPCKSAVGRWADEAKAQKTPARLPKSGDGEKWSPDAMEMLKKLAGGKMSATAIAAELQAAFPDHDYSRNSVIGKVNREGFSLSASTGGWRPQRPVRGADQDRGITQRIKRIQYAFPVRETKSAERHRSMPPDDTAIRLFGAPEGGVSFFAVRAGMCRGTDSDNPRDLETFRFCGAPCGVEDSFCAYHQSRYFQTRDGRPARQKPRSEGIEIAASMLADVGIGAHV